MCKDDYPQMLEELELEPFEDTLDVGCGTGAVLELLHARYPNKHLTGLDLTPGMIDVARAKQLDNVRLERAATNVTARLSYQMPMTCCMPKLTQAMTTRTAGPQRDGLAARSHRA